MAEDYEMVRNYTESLLTEFGYLYVLEERSVTLLMTKIDPVSSIFGLLEGR